MPSLPSLPVSLPVTLPSPPTLLQLWQGASKVPHGKRAFSLAFSRKAPYFATVSPRFVELREDYAELVIPLRKSTQNHIGTLHAIAVCNGLEAAMGALAEVSIPDDKRWLPKGMQVSYTAKSTSDITCIAETDRSQWTGDDPDLPVRVKAVREDGTTVVEGTINLWVTRKPAKK
ncbi:DUF4442 domain-containing protein [Nocardioidaceae bacterium]|nr:DUF4442 domain-containing protein [Nocardioidaceae bacterium]